MAVRDFGNKPIVETEGKQTNPTTSTLMADTGALTQGGLYQVVAVLGASAVATFLLQRRNTANDGNTGDVPVIYVAAGQSCQVVFTFEAAAGERFRVMMDANLTGTAAATLNVEKLT